MTYIPSTWTTVDVLIVGGGGPGGNVAAGGKAYAAGGGGGAVRQHTVNVSAGDTWQIFIGAGGRPDSLDARGEGSAVRIYPKNGDQRDLGTGAGAPGAGYRADFPTGMQGDGGSCGGGALGAWSGGRAVEGGHGAAGYVQRQPTQFDVAELVGGGGGGAGGNAPSTLAKDDNGDPVAIGDGGIGYSAPRISRPLGFGEGAGSEHFFGGGGANGYYLSVGGAGGGADAPQAVNNSGQNGAKNTGGGGSGAAGWLSETDHLGGRGGSGLVIISYPGRPIADVDAGNRTYYRNGVTYHVCTGSGNVLWRGTPLLNPSADDSFNQPLVPPEIRSNEQFGYKVFAQNVANAWTTFNNWWIDGDGPPLPECTFDLAAGLIRVGIVFPEGYAVKRIGFALTVSGFAYLSFEGAVDGTLGADEPNTNGTRVQLMAPRPIYAGFESGLLDPLDKTTRLRKVWLTIEPSEDLNGDPLPATGSLLNFNPLGLIFYP